MEPVIWLGPEEGIDRVKAAQVRLQETKARSSSFFDDIEMPRLYHLDGDVGVVSIKGDLVSGDAGWLQLFGIVGYDNIAAAITEAIKDSNAKTILLDVKSPGGAVSGVLAAAELIRNADKVKPVTAFAENIGSAAYWLGSASRHITLDPLGTAGSIGAVIVHSERSKQLANDGIAVNVIRSGPHKMVANSVEPLSREGEEYLRNMVDYSSQMFVQAVANHRKTSPMTVETRMGGGQVFMGTRALDVGLVDKVGFYRDAHAQSRTFSNRKHAKV